jgi:hypothetical protein
VKNRDFSGNFDYTSFMPGNPSEPDPFLQKSPFGPRIATGHVDPCILYLEATEAGEVPILFACWARSSREVREAGEITRLKLEDVVLLVGRPLKSLTGWCMQDGKTSWNFAVYRTRELQIRKDASGWYLKGLPDSRYFQSKSVGYGAYGYQGSLKFLDRRDDHLLFKLRSHRCSKSRPFVQKILELAPVEWPSLVNALAFLQNAPKPQFQHRRRSLLRQIISTVFPSRELERV